MLLSPALLTLMFGSLLISAFAVYAAMNGLQIIWWWDLHSGSDRQLRLERKTYLISTVVAIVLAFELMSLFVFIHTADDIHSLFVGAMCAAGSLNVNGYGYPTLLIRIMTFMACGIWLVVNHTDNRGWDYPLIRTKYKLLLVITALLILETVLQANYFLRMQPDVITSCCGTLFSDKAQGLAGSILTLPSSTTKIVFYVSVGLVLSTGMYFYGTGRGALIFSASSNWLVCVSLVAIISFISLYFYELPTHHCPFCLLQKEYHYIGYPLYLSLFTAGIMGASVGGIDHFREHMSLKNFVPVLQRRFCLISIGGFVIFTVISTYPILFSGFKLEGY